MPKPRSPSAQDLLFYEQVRKLLSTSNRAREEAEQYADNIDDPKLKAEAKELLDL